MIPEQTLVERKQALVFVVPREQRDVERDTILDVLARAADDDGFVAELTFAGEEALREYPLSLEAQAALLGGDVRWLEARLGKLDGRLGTWPSLRLQQEIW